MASNGTGLKETEEFVKQRSQIGMRVVRKRSSNFVWLFLSFLAVRPEVVAARPEVVAWDSLMARHYLNQSHSNY